MRRSVYALYGVVLILSMLLVACDATVEPAVSPATVTEELPTETMESSPTATPPPTPTAPPAVTS